MDRHIDWPTAALTQTLAPLLPGFGIEVLAQVDSTNSELMRRARAGNLAPTLLVAEQQTEGRGRLGRSWVSTADGGAASGLTFSLGLPLAPQAWSGLSLAVGLALAESLDPGNALGLRLKWPNDLLRLQRKLAGVLIETSACSGPNEAAAGGDLPASRFAVVGVGLNITAPQAPLGALRTPAAWLGELLPGCTAPAALARVAAPLAHALLAFERYGFAPWQARFAARDALLGQAVELADGSSGVACGVCARGLLQVRTASGVQAIESSEVSLRRSGVSSVSDASDSALAAAC